MKPEKDQWIYIPTYIETGIPGMKDPTEREEEEQLEFSDEFYRG